MKITKTNLQDCFVLEPRIYEDERGYFFESYNHKIFEETVGSKLTFVQDNQSYSTRGVLRGLHFQKGEYAQAKLVRVLQGEVLDVVVDLRESSPSYGQHHTVVLSEENKKQVFVPRGFAHGFVVLSEKCHFFYKCDNYYYPQSESGIRYDDPSLAIDWKLSKDDLIVSDKDRRLSFLM